MPRWILICPNCAYRFTHSNVEPSAVQEIHKVRGEAVDGVEAIEKASKLQPDLVLLDLAMPRLNGAEAASVIRSAMPRVPILLFTMYADDF
jgi:DNA-binding NarL/FixJ family response regulator